METYRDRAPLVTIGKTSLNAPTDGTVHPWSRPLRPMLGPISSSTPPHDPEMCSTEVTPTSTGVRTDRSLSTGNSLWIRSRSDTRAEAVLSQTLRPRLSGSPTFPSILPSPRQGHSGLALSCWPHSPFDQSLECWHFTKSGELQFPKIRKNHPASVQNTESCPLIMPSTNPFQP